MHKIELAMRAAAGLALFLSGLSLLARELERVAGERARSWLERATRRRRSAIGVGALATAILDSSSATIIIVIGLLEAGLVPLERAIGLALGANIGTAFGSQVIALNLTAYSGGLLLVGFVARAAGRHRRRLRSAGALLFALGLVLFGLHQIGAAAAPLKDTPRVVEGLRRLEHPAAGVLAGALVTAVVQSSSASVGIAVVLASEGVISLPVGASVMLGAEVGTCLDVLLASVGRSRETLRLGLFQLFFNLTAVLVGVPLLTFITAAARALSPEVPRQVAYAHLLFNIGSVLLVAPFVLPVAKLLERIVPPVRAAPTRKTGRVT